MQDHNQRLQPKGMRAEDRERSITFGPARLFLSSGPATLPANSVPVGGDWGPGWKELRGVRYIHPTNGETWERAHWVDSGTGKRIPDVIDSHKRTSGGPIWSGTKGSKQHGATGKRSRKDAPGPADKRGRRRSVRRE